MKARITVILNGRRDDRGFVQEGYEGAIAARDRFGIDLTLVDHTQKDPRLLLEQVEVAAAGGADGVIVHGSRADAPIGATAPRHPDCRFLSPGGHAGGPNVWNYAVRHYEAAYLAGMLAALSTRTGTVGHLSGVFIGPGRRGRAAFVDGVRRTDPNVRIVTGFCGDQDDPALAAQWTAAEAAAGADVIFTMLNYGRSGAIAACREAGIRQIGNIRDWCSEEPDVFVGSAIAAHRWSVLNWIGDLVEGRLQSGVDRNPGLETPEAVRLALAPSVPEALGAAIAAAAEKIRAGGIVVADDYDGPEFHPSATLAQTV